jgi:hypothetical protein
MRKLKGKILGIELVEGIELNKLWGPYYNENTIHRCDMFQLLNELFKDL